MAIQKFGLLTASDAKTRMTALFQFIEFWFGSRQPHYGESEEQLNRIPLPGPLRQFYSYAGRWPSAQPDQQELFYTGGAGHHLRALEDVTVRDDGRVDFFMEYQGDWEAVTLAEGDDPPVWLTGCFEEYDGEQTIQVSDSLSKFLVTHCLMTILYEIENAATKSARSGELVDYFNEHFVDRFYNDPEKLWDASCLNWPRSCLDYTGEFFLFNPGILLQRVGQEHRFAALQLPAIQAMMSRLQAK